MADALGRLPARDRLRLACYYAQGLTLAQIGRTLREHEATTSKIGDDQLFYCLSRGIAEEDAVNMIVNGFCKAVFKELPMEFAVEAQNLLAVSLEGSVG